MGGRQVAGGWSRESAVADRPQMVFGATAFFERTFEETLRLCRETRDYMLDNGPPAPDAPLSDQLAFCVESMRLTARLTQVMAWLLAQRAAAAGEITADELAGAAWRLAGHTVCLAQPAAPAERLPARLRELLERGDRLYRRIARLDDMVAGGRA